MILQYGSISVSAPYANLPFQIPYGIVAQRLHGGIVAPLDLCVWQGAELLYRFVVLEIEGLWFVRSIGLLAHPLNRFDWGAVRYSVPLHAGLARSLMGILS